MASQKSHSVLNKIISIMALTLISVTSFAASVSVVNPYARAVAEGHPNSAAFMVLKNNSAQDRALVTARSSVSKVVELHTHTKEGGMMRMRQVEKMVVKAKSETVLKPGGLHVMLIGLKQALIVGNNVDLELEFDNGEIIKLSVPVKMVAGMNKMKMKMKKQH